MDVLAVDGGDEGLVQALDDLVGEEVAFVLDFLDLVGLVGVRRIDGEHLFEQAGPGAHLVGHGHEIDVERLFTRNQTEAPHQVPLRKRADCI